MSATPALVWLSLWTGCTAEPEPPPRPTSVLLVTLDTTRADRLGPYGYAQADTPTLDALAADGATFLRAYSSSPQTIPAHATLLTGVYPPTHGVRDHGDFRLDDDQVTLAERLGAAGWRTAAFTSAITTRRRWGLAQGFDLYHDPRPQRRGRLDWRDQRRADEVVDDVVATLPRLAGDAPVFAWVHLFDPHWPYDPPEPHATAHLGRPYDGEIAFVDVQLARLIAAWDEHFDPGTALIVVTADHGEGLGDAGERVHGHLLHDGTLRVPLIVRGPGFTAGDRPTDLVSHVDIVPTVLALVQQPIDPGLQGLDLRAGGDRWVYHEALASQHALGLAPLFGFTDPTGRYVEGAWGGWYPVHEDRVSGVGTREDPEGGKGERLDAIRESLPVQLGDPDTLDLATLEGLSRLGDLGGGDPHALPGDVDPRDVMETIDLTWQVRQLLDAGLLERAARIRRDADAKLPETFDIQLLEALLLRRQGQLYGAVEAFGELYMLAPGSTVALQLAALHASVGDWREASIWYERAHDHQPESPESLVGRARSALVLGPIDLAETHTARFRALYPDHAAGSVLRAELWLADGQLPAALEASQEALERMPDSPWAHQVHGEVRWGLGDSEEALAELRTALRLDPFQAAVRIRLVEMLLELGRAAEALRIIAPLSRLLPDVPHVLELYERAKASMTIEDRHEIRRDRALGPYGGRK